MVQSLCEMGVREILYGEAETDDHDEVSVARPLLKKLIQLAPSYYASALRGILMGIEVILLTR